MAHFRAHHPWNPGYAIPKSVLAEPPGNRGARITAQLPRRTISENTLAVPPWRTGFVLPREAAEDPPGRGARVTFQLPRKTVDTLLVPALGDDRGPENPLARFGQDVADVVLSKVKSLPPKDRLGAIRVTFDAIEPGLYGRMLARMHQNLAAGMLPEPALRAAIESATSQGLVKEIVALGRGQRPAPRSMAGLGYYGKSGAHEALGFSFSDLWKKPASQIKNVGQSIGVAAKWTGGAVSSGAKSTWNFAGDVIDKVEKLSCKVLNSPAAPVAAGAAAAAYGAPPQAGMIGAQVGQALCAPDASGQMVPVVMEPPSTIPWVPIALGGGALVLILLMTRGGGGRGSGSGGNQ